SDNQCEPELVSSITTTYHNISDEQSDNEIVFENVKLIKSKDNKSYPSVNNDENSTTSSVTQCVNDEYDTLDELFDIAKLLSDSMNNQQQVVVVTSMEKAQLKSEDEENNNNYEQNTEKAAFSSNKVDDIGVNRYDLSSQTSDNHLISSRNVELNQIVIGYPDRMSIVVEESDDDYIDGSNGDYTSEASFSQEECHEYSSQTLVNELPSVQQDIHKEQTITFVDSLDEPLREKSGSSSTSDVTTIDENEVACEIEIHPQPLDHWV
ncbi:unnamed protein product, partial [Schistosoma turkestanicum]